MIRVCVECGRVYGEKDPLEDRSYTHGLCRGCLKRAIRVLRARRDYGGRCPINLERSGMGC